METTSADIVPIETIGCNLPYISFLDLHHLKNGVFRISQQRGATSGTHTHFYLRSTKVILFVSYRYSKDYKDEYKKLNRPLPNCINLTQYLLSKPLASFPVKKYSHCHLMPRTNARVGIVNILSIFKCLYLMHADENITLSLTFKGEFGIGQLLDKT